MTNFLEFAYEVIIAGYLKPEEAFIYNKFHPNDALRERCSRVTKDQALIYAAMNGWSKGIVILKPYSLNHILNYASKGGQLSLARTLIDGGANHITRAIKAAAYGGHIPTIEFLLRRLFESLEKCMRGVSLHYHSYYNNMILVHGSFGGHISVLQFAIRNGAYNLEDALCATAEGCHLYVMKWLVSRIPSVKAFSSRIRDVNWSKVLAYAGKGGDVSIIQWIEARCREKNITLNYEDAYTSAVNKRNFDAMLWLGPKV